MKTCTGASSNTSLDMTCIPLIKWVGEVRKMASCFDLWPRIVFDALITADKNMRHQQNFQQQNISVILLSVKSLALENFLPLIPKIKKVLNGTLKAGVTVLE